MKQRNTEMPKVGTTFSGFTVTKQGKIRPLGADTILFKHAFSGAELLWINNSDTELGFNIIYRTPCLDETDVNHALEHAVVASSRKYPSRDIFFDMANKSCNTFVNAYTYPVMTCYALCSQSEEQLKKLVDVYLSCMAEPDFLHNSNIFKREALRYELRDKEEAIQLTGTVYNEDFAYLADTSAEAQRNMLQALYPGLYASGGIGRAHRNYGELTYENAIVAYERYYSFDNALIVLYGSMDCEKMLSFLDGQYLSAARPKNRDVTQYFNESVKPGHVEKIVESPAYEEDVSEGVAILEYGIDVSEYSWEEQFRLDLLAELMSHENSPFHRRLKALGINNQAYCSLSMEHAKNFFLMGIENGEESQKKSFQQAVREALTEVSRNGVDEEIARAILKDRELSEYLAREGTALAVDVSSGIGLYWSLTGQVDYYEQQDSALEAVKNDKEQAILKGLAAKLSEPGRSALVVTVPAPGLAEQIEQELEDLLAQRKESMAEDELEALILATREFDEWNQNGSGNNDFTIDPQDLPVPMEVASYTKRQLGDVISYTSPVELERAGYFRLLFDTSAVKEEDLYYLPLYTLLLLELDTERYPVEEQRILEMEYLSQLSFTFAYPGTAAEENHHPMLCVRWYGLTEDYEDSIDFLIEVLRKTKFDGSGRIVSVIEKYMADYDLSRSDDHLGTAIDLADGYVDGYQAYVNYVEGQGFYRFLENTLEALKKDSTYGQRVKEKLEGIVQAASGKRRLCALTAACESQLPRLEEIIERRLNALEGKEEDKSRTLKEEAVSVYEVNYSQIVKPAPTTGVYVESADQYSVRVSSFLFDPQFQGRYLAYLMAVGDKYIIPRIRFQGGAYDAGASFRISMEKICVYSSSDPNVGDTLDIFDGIEEYLAGADLTQEDLDGYILNAYSAATQPQGGLSRSMDAMGRAVEGVDSVKTARIIADIREARLSDKAAAAASLGRILRAGCTVTLGNEGILSKEKHRFNEVISYKK